jgi:ligand-binding sensor domain-containing protein/type II secretory pathway pseudopilin PulG
MLKKIFFLVLLLILQTVVSAQRYNFANYSVEEGLPQSQINSIYEDTRGYLWFGTFGGGLSRFDGINFVNYNEEQGLSCSFVRSISQSQSGNLLVGTDEGLFVLVNDKFIRYYHAGVPKKPAIRTIISDHQKNIWVGTIDYGLFCYSHGEIKNYTEKDGLLGNNVNYLFCDKKGNIWVGQDNGFCKIDHGKITPYNKVGGGLFVYVRGITEDKNGRIWFVSYVNGAAVFDGKSFTKYSTRDGLASNTVTAVLCDEKENMWFGTAQGLTRLKGNTFKTITSAEGLCSNNIISILEDADKNLWFGSSGGGVSRYDNERFIHFSESEYIGKSVYAIKQDYEGNMWFATSSGGVTRYDGKDFKKFNGENGFTSEKIKAIYCNADSTIWFGSEGYGVFFYNGKTFERITSKNGLCGNFISGITADKYENIWFSSLDNGAGFYNTKTKKYYRYRKKDGLASSRINSMCADKNGKIWLGTSNAGINSLSFSEKDTSSVTVSTINQSNGLSGNNINTLIENKNKIYIGTSGSGISVLKPDGKIICWNKKQGLSSNIIYSLVFDNYGNLWAGSEKGIDKIILQKDSILQVIHFSKAEGFFGVENTRNSSFLDKAGNLWFGTINGANRYNPNFDHSNTSAPNIHLTAVNLFFDRIEETEYGQNCSTFEELSGNLVLPYYKNHLSFDFIGINYRNPQAVKYKWKLLGNDKEWSPVLGRREATYSNLPPGKYTFIVKACNENGVWSSKVASFSFIITAPFWTSAWFIILIVIAVISIIWFIIFSRIRRIKSRNKDEQQRLEMSKSILELQQATSRLQMNPHFIFNSLNSIQGYIANNNTTEAKWYLSKFAKLMRLILDNAKEEFIPLSDDIYILDNYLLLEKMRMNDKFDYSVVCDEAIETDAVEIPPMIIQPFVENAILHGLKHKEGKGFLEIKFSQKGNVLICEVTDNGIGRKAAADLKIKSAAEHKSSAIMITEERLKRLGKEFQQEAGVEIIDLKGADDKACGTKVIIKIPI